MDSSRGSSPTVREGADCTVNALPNGRATAPYSLLVLLLLSIQWGSVNTLAQTSSSSSKSKTAQSRATKGKAKPAKPVDELTRLREEFIKATNEFKSSLKLLRASYEKSVRRAEDELVKSRELFQAGLISRKAVEAGEAEVAAQKKKVEDVDRDLINADSQIAGIVLEAEADAKMRRSKPIPRGGLVSTTALIRYNGAAVWALGDSWKVQRFFQDTFKKQLPIAVFGQGAIHDRWRLDHRNSMDVSLHPDGPEGQALLNFLRANGIPFLAFRAAIPGTATGPHIHIGRPSHRY